MRDARHVEPGGDLGAHHDADHEGREDQAERELGGGGEEDGGPEEDEDVHGGLCRGLNQSQDENIPLSGDSVQTQLITREDPLLTVPVVLLPTKKTFNVQLSTVICQLSSENCQLS